MKCQKINERKITSQEGLGENMERHFEEKLGKLRDVLMQMGFLVQANLEKAVRSLVDRDEKLAYEVLQGEDAINALEIEIDDRGHALIALGQPLAHDLRFVTMALKIVTDFERIGDHAVNIAEKSLFVLKSPPLAVGNDLSEMANATLQMFRTALDAFVREDVELARKVLESDDLVDGYNRNLYDQLETLLQSNPALTREGLNLLMTGHNLERVADLACNIAEDVIYLKQGKEIRHRYDL